MALLLVGLAPVDAHNNKGAGGEHRFDKVYTASAARHATGAKDTVTDGHCTYTKILHNSVITEGAKSCDGWVFKGWNIANGANTATKRSIGFKCTTGHWGCVFAWTKKRPDGTSPWV